MEEIDVEVHKPDQLLRAVHHARSDAEPDNERFAGNDDGIERRLRTAPTSKKPLRRVPMLFEKNLALTLNNDETLVLSGTQPEQPEPNSDPALPETPLEDPEPFDPDPYPDFRDVPPMRPIDGVTDS